MTSTASARLALLIPLVAFLVACGSETSAPSTAGVSEAPVASPAAASDETRLSCGGEPPGWPAFAMDGGIDSRHSTDDLASALEALAHEAGMDAPRALQDVSIQEARWFVLAETAAVATVATGAWDVDGPAPDGQVVHLEQAGGEWTARGWGDCTDLAPVLAPGSQWVQVVAAPGRDPSSVGVTVVLNETECASGRDPQPFLRTPRIVETDDSVTLHVTSEAPRGAQSCQSNPTVREVVQLEQPLGDRLLLDGSRWPARPIPDHD